MLGNRAHSDSVRHIYSMLQYEDPCILHGTLRGSLLEEDLQLQGLDNYAR